MELGIEGAHFGQLIITLSGQLITTLLGALSGAWIAFKLNAHNNEKEAQNKKVAAANRALFVLIAQWNMLADFKQKHIDPHRDDPARFISMNALPPLEYTNLNLDIQSLNFLLETDFRQLLLSLLLEEQHFRDAIQAINLRSSLHLESAQPRLVEGHIQNGQMYSIQEIRVALGPLLSDSLTNATNNVIIHVDSTCSSLAEIIEEAANVFKLTFPSRKFIKFEISQPG